jgi:hypothetical protein
VQAVPSFRTPALGNPMPFHDQMRQPAFAQLLAHRQSGLTTANYERFDVLSGHDAALFQLGDDPTLAKTVGRQCLSVAQASTILRLMKVEEIAEAVAKLPPDQLARFRRWFTAFEANRPDHAKELDSAATKLGRFAGRAFAELKRRTKEP